MSVESAAAAPSPGKDVVVYGLARCDSTKKALNWLTRSGFAHRFVDYREQPVPPSMLRGWSALVGWDALINRQSKTWRELLPSRKSPGSEPEYLLLLKEYPVLIKRPVLVVGDKPLFGFTDRLYKTAFGR